MNNATAIDSALADPACQRLAEWAAIGPVQRAAVESFADRLAQPGPVLWYCITADHLATLCVDEADARRCVEQYDRTYPRHAPHRVAQMAARPHPQR